MLENDQTNAIKDVVILTKPDPFVIKNDFQTIGGWVISEGYLKSFDGNGNLISSWEYPGPSLPMVTYGVVYYANKTIYFLLGNYDYFNHSSKVYSMYVG